MPCITTRPYENDPALADPIPDDFVRALFMLKDTTVFGLIFGLVYGTSLLMVIIMTALVPCSTSKRDRMNKIVPFVLATPFWITVFLCSTNLTQGTRLDALRLPFTEAVFWATLIWAVFVSAFVVVGTLICVLWSPRKRTLIHVDEKNGDRAAPLTLVEALALAPPHEAPEDSANERPNSPSDAHLETRTRMGSVTRCWH